MRKALLLTICILAISTLVCAEQFTATTNPPTPDLGYQIEVNALPRIGLTSDTNGIITFTTPALPVGDHTARIRVWGNNEWSDWSAPFDLEKHLTPSFSNFKETTQ